MSRGENEPSHQEYKDWLNWIQRTFSSTKDDAYIWSSIINNPSKNRILKSLIQDVSEKSINILIDRYGVIHTLEIIVQLTLDVRRHNTALAMHKKEEFGKIDPGDIIYPYDEMIITRNRNAAYSYIKTMTGRDPRVDTGDKDDCQNILRKESILHNHPVTYKDIFKRIFLHRELGSGAQGRVFLGQDSVSGLYMAVKVIFGNPEDFRETQIYDYMINENYDTSHVVKIYGQVLIKKDDSKVLFILEERVRGDSLEKMVRSFNTKDFESSVITAFYIIYQMLYVVNYLSSRHIYHMDYHSGNMVWDDRNKQLKIIDFGMVCLNTSITPIKLQCDHEMLGSSTYSLSRVNYSFIQAILLEILNAIKLPGNYDTNDWVFKLYQDLKTQINIFSDPVLKKDLPYIQNAILDIYNRYDGIKRIIMEYSRKKKTCS